MKKIIWILAFFTICFCAFTKELSGNDLKAVHKVLDSKLYINDYETADEKKAYLSRVEKSIDFSSLSQEASLICKNSLKMAKDSATTTKYDLSLLVEAAESAKKKEKKDKIDEAAKKKALDFFGTYEKFAETHNDLSSYFWFHYKEAELGTLAYLPTTQQLKKMGGLLDEYKNLVEMNPNNSECLFMYGMILYMMPGVLGGSKKDGLAKIKKAVETAACDYETATASIMLSQILLDEGKTDESKYYMNKVLKIDPKNKMVLMIKELNDNGYSIFQMEKYIKKNSKKK